MREKGTWTRSFCQRRWALAVRVLAVALVLTVAPTGARAEEGATGPAVDAPRETGYLGAFWGVQLHAGVVWRRDGGPGEGPGPLLGLSGRLATLMSLLDAQLTLATARYDARTRAGQAVDVARYSASVELRLHPFFMAHLHNTNAAFWKGALYLAIGAGLEVLSADAPGVDTTRAAFGWHLGLGSDLPLGDVDDGGGVWLGIAYRFEFLGHASGVAGLGDFDEHMMLVTVAWRGNDIAFARVPRPVEFDDRDRPPR